MHVTDQRGIFNRLEGVISIADCFQNRQVRARFSQLIVEQKQHFAQRQTARRKHAVTHVLQQCAIRTKPREIRRYTADHRVYRYLLIRRPSW